MLISNPQAPPKEGQQVVTLCAISRVARGGQIWLAEKGTKVVLTKTVTIKVEIDGSEWFGYVMFEKVMISQDFKGLFSGGLIPFVRKNWDTLNMTPQVFYQPHIGLLLPQFTDDSIN